MTILTEVTGDRCLREILIVDVGNSDIKRVVVSSGGEFGPVERDATADIERVSREIAESKIPFALSSVRAGAADSIKQALHAANKSSLLLTEISAAVAHPVRGFYAGFGADRVADVAAAYVRHGSASPVAVVGLGTGTAITAVNATGEFSGGFTTLGLGAICKAITLAIPALPAIDPEQVEQLEPAFDVYQSLCRGTVAAHVGLVEKWVALLKDKLGSDLTVVATGGMSRIVAPLTECIDEVDPLLTMRGIWTIAKLSAK